MSARSMRRAQARRLAYEQRREALRLRRSGLVAGVMAGSAMFGVPAAQGANFPVSNLSNSGGGSLRDAVNQANAAAGDDTITFTGAGASGIIRIGAANTPIVIDPADNTGKLTITGPGAGALTVSGDVNSNGTLEAADSQVFKITGVSTNPVGSVTISGLTITNGYDPAAGSGGGAILVDDNAPLTLTDVDVTNSKTDGTAGGSLAPGGGGAIRSDGNLTLTRVTISGNSAPAAVGGGIAAVADNAASKYALKITDSTVSGNTAKTAGGGVFQILGTMAIQNSHVTGNHATNSGIGGGILAGGKYSNAIRDSVISGNTANVGGGLSIYGFYAFTYTSTTVRNTTISGNQAPRGAGLQVGQIHRGARVTIDHTTISGNQGGASSFGGGLLIDRGIGGTVDLLNSTISGNTATAGAGVSLGSDSNQPLFATDSNGNTVGAIDFLNSTIAANTADSHGGGVYLSQYDSGSPSVKKSGGATITSTIVADDTAGGAAQDLDRVDTSTSGGFDSAFSLIENPGDAPLTQQATITGTDPVLGALGDNGGPTLTQKPAGTSPVIDQGHAPTKPTTDQRGQPRIVDTGIANPAGGDGTDIGAIELDAASVVLPPPPPTPVFLVGIHGLALGGAAVPLLAAGSTPVDCAITIGSLTTCVVEIRTSAATTTRAKSVAAGTMLASGAVTSAGAGSLRTKVTLTTAGRRVLAKRPLGFDAAAVVTGSAAGSHTALGTIHLLRGPSFTVRTGTRSAKFPKGVVTQLDQVAALLKGTKTVTCTAYTDKSVSTRADNRVSASQAKAACKRLVAKGVTATIKSAGKGHAKPVASNKTAKGRLANRRVVISFTY